MKIIGSGIFIDTDQLCCRSYSYACNKQLNELILFVPT